MEMNPKKVLPESEPILSLRYRKHTHIGLKKKILIKKTPKVVKTRNKLFGLNTWVVSGKMSRNFKRVSLAKDWMI